MKHDVHYFVSSVLHSIQLCSFAKDGPVHPGTTKGAVNMFLEHSQLSWIHDWIHDTVTHAGKRSLTGNS